MIDFMNFYNRKKKKKCEICDNKNFSETNFEFNKRKD